MEDHNIVFGPIPSRRLGRSLGINNIPPKICSYSCVYCQLGRAIEMSYERHSYYTPEKIFKAVEEKVNVLKQRGEKNDYLTFVPDGESTLDMNLGKEIDLLRYFNIKQAIITNSSLTDREDVRKELMEFDLVSLIMDSAIETTWRKIDRPHKMIDFKKMKDGMQIFANQFQGKLITETMLIRGYNDSEESLRTTADFIATLKPAIAYISIPTRPPARREVQPSDEKAINKAFQIFSEKTGHVEYLLGHEGNAFAHSGDTREDLLSITAVHPMRDDSVQEFLKNDGKDWSLVEALISEGKLLETEFGGHKFYVRKLSDRQQT